MYAHLDGIDLRRARRTAMWLGLGILLILTVGMILVDHAGLEGRETAVTMAAIAALGTLAIGRLFERTSAYPRWAWNASAGIMATAIVISAVLVEPAAWRDDAHSMTWMLPWFLLTMGTQSAAKQGRCSPAHPRAGWFMVVGAVLMSIIVLGAPSIVDAIRGR